MINNKAEREKVRKLSASPLRYFHEEEMKVILDCAIGTLKSRLHRARERLRKLLDDGTY